MKPQTTLSPLLACLLTFLLICGLGFYFNEVAKVGSRSQALRNINVQMPDRGISGGKGAKPGAANASSQTNGASDSATKEQPGGEADQVDPVAVAEALQRGAIFGRAVTTEGFPVAGVVFKFSFSKKLEGGKPPPTYEAKTNETGELRIEQVLAGNYTITSQHPFYKSAHAKSLDVREGLPFGSSDFVMQSTLELSVQVKDSRNSSVSDAKVELFYIRTKLESEAGGAVRMETLYKEGKTNNKGACPLKGVSLGLQKLVVSYPGYVRSQQEVLVEGKPGPVQVTLEPASTLGGIVRTTTGRPLDKATIKLTSEKNPKLSWEVKSDKGGFFFPEIPEAHLFTLVASSAGYLPTTLKGIPAGRTNVIVELEAGGSISGEIVNFTTGSKAGGIAVVCNSAVNPNPATALRVTSQADGTYSFMELPAGQYNLYIQSETLTSEPRLGVTVKSGTATNDVNFSIYEGLKIQGYVADASTGERISGAAVKLESQVGPQFLEQRKSETKSNELGLFLFKNIPYGLYSLSATAEGYRKVPGGDSVVQLHLLPGETVEPQELLLSRGGVITGTVLGNGNVPVPNATVQVYAAPDAVKDLGRGQLKAFDAKTDSSGSFKMEGLPLDDRLDLIVSADAQGYAKGKSEPLVLTEFLPTAYTSVYLRAGNSVLVKVEGDEGFALVGADVSYYSHDFPGDDSPARWASKTNTQGEVLFKDLPNGNATVSASKAGYLREIRNIVLPSEAKRVELTLSPSTTISGRVTDDANVPFGEGWVAAYAESGSFGGGRANLDSNGFFRIEGIGSGTFTLEAEGLRSTPTGKHAVRHLVRKIRAGEDQVTISIPMRGRIEGTVVDQQTLDPIPKATIKLSGRYEVEPGTKRGFGSSFATNQIPGKFDFVSLPPGEYTLTYNAPGYLPITTENPVTVGSPGWRNMGKVLLSKGAQIRGLVVDAKTRQPLSGVTVRLTPSGKITKSNAKGIFGVSALEPQIYSLEFSHPDYLNTKQDLVQVSPNKVTDAGQVEMSAGASISIQVLDARNNPVSRASVSIRETLQEKSRTGNTDAGGRITFNGLEPGGVFISVSKSYRDGALTKTVERTITKNDSLKIQITLEGGFSLEGMIVPPPGKTFTNPFLSLYPIESDGRPINRGNMTVPLEQNRFKLSNLSAGNYLLCAQVTIDNSAARWHTSIRLSEPNTTITLQPPASSLSGKILSQNAVFEVAPMENANIRLRALTFPHSGFSSLQSWWQWQTTASGTGAYRIPYLRAGEYELVVTPIGSDEPYVDIITIQQNRAHVYDVIMTDSP